MELRVPRGHIDLGSSGNKIKLQIAAQRYQDQWEKGKGKKGKCNP